MRPGLKGIVNIKSVIVADALPAETAAQCNPIAADTEPCERQPYNGVDFMLKLFPGLAWKIFVCQL